MVCPKTMRRIPENYVPCVFLGQQGPIKASKCPAMGWDASAVLDEESSRSSMELNNNSCIDKECRQWTEKRPTRPSKEVGDLKKQQQKTQTFLDLKKLIKLISDTEVSVCRSHKFRLQTDLNYNIYNYFIFIIFHSFHTDVSEIEYQ